MKKSTRKKLPVLKDSIIKALADVYPKPLNYKQLSGILQIKEQKSREKVLKTLNSLRDSEDVEEISPGKFRSGSPKPIIIGTIEIARNGDAFLHSEESGSPAMVSPGKLRNAMNGDRVKAYIYTNKRTGHVEGEVIEITERKKTEFVGTIQLGRQFAFLVPDSRKSGLDIYIPLQSLNGAKDGEKAVAKIVEWPLHGKNPVGEIIRVLGTPGQNSVEMHSIMTEYGLPYEFPESILHAAENIPTEIPADEINRRKDFRSILTFTIDPVDAKDFDDALSIRKAGDGLWEIGVHIADVSYYVKEGDPVDEEAFNRGTSVYLVDRVVPMLPEVLSNQVCSLRPGEDKLCYTALFVLDETGDIKSEWFGRTIIHSDTRFSYEEAQQVIETGKGKHAEELLTLNKIAHSLREARLKKGSIDFHSTEVRFRLDDRGEPVGVFIKEQKEANKLVEDFMLLANRRVAEAAGKALKKSFVYRVHDQPEQEKLQAFGNFVKKLGLKFQPKEKKSVQASMNRIIQSVSGKRESSIVEQMAIRAMAKASYSPKNIGHYGLGFDYYTHFTSPIRRYPDLMVHRLLNKFLNGEKISPIGLEDACKHTSEREKLAAEAERSSIKFMQVKFLQDKIGQIFKGVVSGMNEWGLYVEINENKCEGMVRLRDINDDYYIYDEENFHIVGKRKGKKYKLGDDVMIEVKRADLSRKQIDFILVD